MLTIQDILKAYDTIQKAKYEQELIQEQKKLKSALNEHYTCYNRCYYLKYSPEEREIIIKTLTNIYKNYYKPMSIFNNQYKKEEKMLKKIITKLEKNKIYWKLENKI